MTQLGIHAIIVVSLVAAYTIITVVGADSMGMLGVLAGYIGGAGSTFIVARSNGGIEPK